MALIECPECSRKISDNADSCPGCGYPINPISPVVVNGKAKEGCFLQTLNIGCFMIISFFVIMMLSFSAFYFIKKKGKDKQDVNKEQVTKPKK